MPDEIERLFAGLTADEPEALAEAVVRVDDLMADLRQSLNDAKVRLGSMLRTQGGRFLAVSEGRQIEPTWASPTMTWDGPALVEPLTRAAVGRRRLDGRSGEVESEADAVARAFAEVFYTTNPRLRALEGYIGTDARERFASQQGVGHPSVRIRRL